MHTRSAKKTRRELEDFPLDLDATPDSSTVSSMQFQQYFSIASAKKRAMSMWRQVNLVPAWIAEKQFVLIDRMFGVEETSSVGY